MAEELEIDAKGLMHAPTGPGLGAAIDFELIERKTEAVLR
jgi:L-alanine-DL-glutamate epimerase-like enolase superfamily enzyme